MYTRLLSIWDSFRTSFWFVPANMMLLAAFAALLLVQFDSRFPGAVASGFPVVQMQPATARSILSSIVSAMVTSTGVVFSITIVALSLASSSFGSRLVRTFQNRRSTQFALGIFVSTSLYCILVLTTIRELDYQFVPVLSVLMAILLTIICLATLVYYIHDMSCAIQAPDVIESSSQALHVAIKRMFPGKIGDPPDPESPVHRIPDQITNQLPRPAVTVQAQSTGYIRAIENEAIEELAVENGVVIRLLVRPGDFIHGGCAVAEILADETDANSASNEHLNQIAEPLNACLMVGPRRTPTQDVRYAFNELVEVAVRALSPGINDPFTAINCVDQIHAALIELRSRRIPSPFRLDDEGVLRVIAMPVSLEECIDGTLAVISHYAEGNPLVSKRVDAALRNFSVATDL